MIGFSKTKALVISIATLTDTVNIMTVKVRAKGDSNDRNLLGMVRWAVTPRVLLSQRIKKEKK